ncbi:MAG: GNAT family N-acetyltransferase [Myxococcales bacterium]
MSAIVIRDYRPEDRAAVRRISFETGMQGQSIAPQYGDLESWADMFTGYYTDREPENGIVAELDGEVVGYMLSALDERRATNPMLYALKHALLRGACFRPDTVRFYLRSVVDTFRDLLGPRAPKVDYDLYPSGPHVNLLPAARRAGVAKEMFYQVFDRVVARGSTGAHGLVQASNQAIIDLATKKLGFQMVGEPFFVPGLRGANGERVAIRILGRRLTDWKIGAWKQADAQPSGTIMKSS